jgi:hypothetical protein
MPDNFQTASHYFDPSWTHGEGFRCLSMRGTGSGTGQFTDIHVDAVIAGAQAGKHARLYLVEGELEPRAILDPHSATWHHCRWPLCRVRAGLRSGHGSEAVPTLTIVYARPKPSARTEKDSNGTF